MSTQLEIVDAQALSLAVEERAQLADRLIASLFDDQDHGQHFREKGES